MQPVKQFHSFVKKEQKVMLTVKWMQSPGLKRQGHIQVASSTRLQYTYADGTPTL